MTDLPNGDERKQATILFADICGSTLRICDVDVEEARDFLATAVQVMRRAAQVYGGQVYRIEGDALLAVFGAPLGQEDQALRACLVAIEIQRRFSERACGDRPLQVRVGIHTGEVIAWHDAESRLDRVDGRSVHLAKRLQEFAQPGRAVLSAGTYRLVSHEFDALPLGHQVLRDIGKVELFELPNATELSPLDPLARRRQMGPLVGRAESLAALATVARQVRGGRLRIVGLRGEAGIGKSRVAAEFANRLRREGFGTAWICARAYATQVPFALAAEMARVLIGLPDVGPLPQREAAVELAAQWPPAQRKHWAAAADLLNFGQPDPAWLQLTPAQRQRDVTETMEWLLTERAGKSPLLLVIDDIFLADRESQRLLEALARRIEALHVLMCVTYRPDFVHRLGDAESFTEHWIGPLQADEMAGLIRGMLGCDPSLASIAGALVERADGSPFFLEQMAMTLVDDGTLVGSPGAYRWVGAGADLRLPDSIAAVIGARVDRLGPAGKASLEAAAIVGRPINGALIGAMQHIGVESAESHLRSALSSGLLVDAVIALDPPEPAHGAKAGPRARAACPHFDFRHGLVQEAVAASLTRPRRKALHRAAFVALRQYHEARLADYASELAHHAYLGESWADAAEHALKAMSRSIARSANRDALRVFSLGLDAVRRLADPQESLRGELALRLEALGAQLPLGQVDELVANLQRAESITQTLGDVRRQAGVQLQLAVIQWTRGRYREGLDAAERAAQAALAAGSRSVRMAAMQAAMLLQHGLGRYPEVERLAQDIERDFAPELAARRILPGWAVMASVNTKVFLSNVLRCSGRLAEAQQCCDAAYREVSQDDHAFSRILIDFVQAELWMEQGRHAEAEQRLQAAMALCRANDILAMHPPLLATLAGSMALGGNAAEAVGLLRKAIEARVDLAGGRYNAFYFPKYLALALAADGRRPEALAAAVAARAAAASFEQSGHEAEALMIQAELEAGEGMSVDAATHFGEAAGRAEACGMSLLAQRCRAGVERLLAETARSADVATAGRGETSR
jgi:predicted ATPase/class 3 adenylate cyclase